MTLKTHSTLNQDGNLNAVTFITRLRNSYIHLSFTQSFISHFVESFFPLFLAFYLLPFPLIPPPFLYVHWELRHLVWITLT